MGEKEIEGKAWGKADKEGERERDGERELIKRERRRGILSKG